MALACVAMIERATVHQACVRPARRYPSSPFWRRLLITP